VKHRVNVRAPKSAKPREKFAPLRMAGVNLWVILTVKGHYLPAILDRGSSLSFVRRDVFQQKMV
jgi:hypothetical protein